MLKRAWIDRDHANALTTFQDIPTFAEIFRNRAGFHGADAVYPLRWSNPEAKRRGLEYILRRLVSAGYERSKAEKTRKVLVPSLRGKILGKPRELNCPKEVDCAPTAVLGTCNGRKR